MSWRLEKPVRILKNKNHGAINYFLNEIFLMKQDYASKSHFILTRLSSMWHFFIPKLKIHFKSIIWGGGGYKKKYDDAALHLFIGENVSTKKTKNKKRSSQK